MSEAHDAQQFLVLLDDPALATPQAVVARIATALLPSAAPAWRESLAWAAGADLAFRVDEGRARLAEARAAGLDAAAAHAPWVRVARLIALRLEVRAAGGAELAAVAEELRAFVAAVPLDEQALVARALHLLGSVELRRGRLDEAEAALSGALEVVGEDAPVRTLWILDGFAQLFQAQGAWQEARRILQALIARKRALGDAIGIAISAGHLARLEVDLGDPGSAAAVLREALAAGDALPDMTRLRLQTLLVQALIDERTDLARGALEVEAERLRALCARARATNARHPLLGYALLALARVAARAGARCDVERLLAATREHFSLPDQVAWRRYWEARLLADDDGVPQEQWWSEMQALFEQAKGVTEAEVHAHLLFAERAAAREDLAAARYHLDAALERATAANNRVWIEQVDQAYRSVDARAFADQLIRRFSGRSRAELARTVTEEATIVFADLVDFTLRSQELTPEEVMQTSRSLFELTVPLMAVHRIRPLSYMGDGLLAVAEGEEHRARGLRFARDLVQRASRATRVRRALANRWGLDVRAGVASGPVVMGTLGNLFKLEFAAIGRTTNLAARLQSKAEPGEVVCAEDTAGEAAREGQLEHFELKGFPRQVAAVRFRMR